MHLIINLVVLEQIIHRGQKQERRAYVRVRFVQSHLVHADKTLQFYTLDLFGHDDNFIQAMLHHQMFLFLRDGSQSLPCFYGEEKYHP